MGKLDGKVAIVTGAARGLGRAYAKRLAGLGAKVAIADINLRSFEEFEIEAREMPPGGITAEIENAGGVAMGIQTDVTDPKAVAAMVAKVMAAWGRIDVLVANAGGAGKPSETHAGSIDAAVMQACLASNFLGTVHAVTAVAPIMKAQGAGKIITIASLAALAPAADGSLADYGAAKAAVAHYTRYLANDLGPHGITANCIAPGLTASGKIQTTIISKMRGPFDSIALRRVGTVEDLAKVVEFLATDLSDYVTGAVIPVDGGMLGA